MLKGLAAEPPAPALERKLRLFGQFVGDWDITARWYQADGSTREGTGELHVAWILNGQAVQDVWISHKDGAKVPVGTTLRFYDPKLDAWRCVWMSPMQNSLRTFIARQIADEIVLEESRSDSRRERWIFSEITPLSFRWRAVESLGSRRAWRLTEDMRFFRVRGS